MQNNQASGMLQALQGANSNINTAAHSAATTAGKGPDFSGLIKALSANTKAQAKDPYGVNKMSDEEFERYIIDDGSSNLF
jgi:hypothetical protein